MTLCMYDEYFTATKTCDRNFACDECEIREDVRRVVLSYCPKKEEDDDGNP